MVPFPSTRWTRKPPREFTRLNRAHPLMRGLADMWVFNNNGGSQEGLLNPSRVFIPVLQIFYLPYWQAGLDGIGAQSYVNNLNGGAGHYEAVGTENVNYAAGDFTVRVRMEPIYISDVFSSLLSKNYNGTSRELGFFFGSGSLSYMDAGASTGVVSGSEGMYVGGLFDFVAVRSGSTVTTYVNGVLKSTFGSYGGTSGGNNARLWIGADQATGAHSAWWNYHSVQIWSRALSAAEVQQQYLDPWCMLMPPNIWWARGTVTAATDNQDWFPSVAVPRQRTNISVMY